MSLGRYKQVHQSEDLKSFRTKVRNLCSIDCSTGLQSLFVVVVFVYFTNKLSFRLDIWIIFYFRRVFSLFCNRRKRQKKEYVSSLFYKDSEHKKE